MHCLLQLVAVVRRRRPALPTNTTDRASVIQTPESRF